MWCDNLGTWPPTVKATYLWMGGAHFFLDQRLFASKERKNSVRAEIYFGQWASLTNWGSFPKSTWPHMDPPGRDCHSWFLSYQVTPTALWELTSAWEVGGLLFEFWFNLCFDIVILLYKGTLKNIVWTLVECVLMQGWIWCNADCTLEWNTNPLRWVGGWVTWWGWLQLPGTPWCWYVCWCWR